MSNRRFVTINDHRIYVNSTIYNGTNSDIEARYSTTFQAPLIDEMGEYQFCLVRFQIPNTLPLFVFKNDFYYITLSYNGDDFSVPLVYNRQDFTTTLQNINNFQQFLDIINTGFTTAFNNLKAAHPGAPPTEAPFIVFNHDVDTFSIYAQQSYDSTTNTIEIYFNSDLYRFFYDSYKVITNGTGLANKKDIQILVTDERNNVPVSPANYYEIRQMNSTIYQWFDIQTIYFTTNMHIKHELVTSRASQGRSIEQPILTDFIPDLSRNDRSQFIYNADPYRWVDCTGHGEVYKFDFQINYLDREGNEHILYLPPNNTISCKFCFERKEIRNNFMYKK